MTGVPWLLGTPLGFQLPAVAQFVPPLPALPTQLLALTNTSRSR